jgi:hypothetical protein
LEKFSAIILLSKSSMTFVCISFPFCLPILCMFGLLIVPQRSFMFHSCFLSINHISLFHPFSLWRYFIYNTFSYFFIFP